MLQKKIIYDIFDILAMYKSIFELKETWFQIVGWLRMEKIDTDYKRLTWNL